MFCTYLVILSCTEDVPHGVNDCAVEVSSLIFRHDLRSLLPLLKDALEIRWLDMLGWWTKPLPQDSGGKDGSPVM